ncbi:DUF4160 domain-containing protein [Endozoicomonas euniceicola]|uniref:DUF4160 domain-containing protein n=1 Tax=Endozoicomonas euniceicola TaxID=1234143 RepID=A0ABY6H0T7_9GAMM|nr:DUF4160 domain-containing protein [Endozoicomonas euniceicola]UYM18525.1 DUF4160 domain-containing protein [Endozoicomonas euniceicola]
MPVISSFFGIYIRMYHDDHPPPHIHVEYQGFEALVGIEGGAVLKGHLPKRAARLVSEWCGEHKNALLNNWQRAIDLQPLERIPGADYD